MSPECVTEPLILAIDGTSRGVHGPHPPTRRPPGAPTGRKTPLAIPATGRRGIAKERAAREALALADMFRDPFGHEIIGGQIADPAALSPDG
jgi:hypothetical protein